MMIVITPTAKAELEKVLDAKKAQIVRVYYGGPG